jgi:DNA-binding Xre family transcriptional regulator
VNTDQEEIHSSGIIFCGSIAAMVRLKIREAAEARGITTAYQLQKAMGVQPGMAARLWKGELEMIALKTLDRLCDAIGCELSDLLVRQSDKRKGR